MVETLVVDYEHAMNWVAGFDACTFSALGFVPVCVTLGFRVIGFRRGMSLNHSLVPPTQSLHLFIQQPSFI